MFANISLDSYNTSTEKQHHLFLGNVFREAESECLLDAILQALEYNSEQSKQNSCCHGNLYSQWGVIKFNWHVQSSTEG